jgi:hypothetical protein
MRVTTPSVAACRVPSRVTCSEEPSAPGRNRTCGTFPPGGRPKCPRAPELVPSGLRPPDADDAVSYEKHGRSGAADCAPPAPIVFDKCGAARSELGSSLAAPRRASRNAAATCTGSSSCHQLEGGSAGADTPSPIDRPRSAGVCHVPQCVQIRRTRSRAISTAASPHGEWAWRKRPAFNQKAGNGLREISGLPSWARHQSSPNQGYADSASPNRRTMLLTRPLLNGGGWGFRSGSNVPQ